MKYELIFLTLDDEEFFKLTFPMPFSISILFNSISLSDSIFLILIAFSLSDSISNIFISLSDSISIF